MSLSIIFLGTGPVAAASLKSLAQEFDIEAVITKPRASHGAAQKNDAPVETLASQLDTKLLFAGTRAELDEVFATHSFVSPLGVVVDYGVIISQSVIDCLPRGIVNSHFSLLPEWRGADPISFSVLSGQSKTGVSIMVIDAGLDTGELLAQAPLSIEPVDTTPTLTDKLVALSNQLLARSLPAYASGELQPYPQPAGKPTYSRKLTKADSVLDFSKPAAQLEREIRAFADWPKSHTSLGSTEVIITKAHVAIALPEGLESQTTPGSVLHDKRRLLIATSDGFLAIDALQPAGKKEMPVQAFLSGYRLA